MNSVTKRSLWTSLLLLLLFPVVSQAHVHMHKSQPAKGEVLATAPTVVQLWFTGAVETGWSKIEVTDSKGARMDEGAVSAIGSDANSMQVKLKPLGSGSYEVKWSSAAHDGHRSKGTFKFSVK